MAVVNGVVKVTIVLRAPVQDSLTTDCLCVLDVGIGTCNRHVKATVTLVPDNYNNDLRIFVFRFFEIGIIAPFALTRELKNASDHQIRQAMFKSFMPRILKLNMYHTSALCIVVLGCDDPRPV
jgi:hypothetical protein